MYVCIYIYMINLKKKVYARCTEAAGLEAGLGALQPWRQCHANFTRVEIQLTGKNKHPLHYSKEAAQLARAVRVWSASLARGISCISNALCGCKAKWLHSANKKYSLQPGCTFSRKTSTPSAERSKELTSCSSNWARIAFENPMHMETKWWNVGSHQANIVIHFCKNNLMRCLCISNWGRIGCALLHHLGFGFGHVSGAERWCQDTKAAVESVHIQWMQLSHLVQNRWDLKKKCMT